MEHIVRFTDCMQHIWPSSGFPELSHHTHILKSQRESSQQAFETVH